MEKEIGAVRQQAEEISHAGVGKVRQAAQVEAGEKVEQVKNQAERINTDKVGQVQQQAAQEIGEIKSQAFVAADQAKRQVELVKLESDRLVSEAARLKEEETERKFAERIKQTELQIQQVGEHFQSRVNEVRGNVKEDYALELRITNLNMEERTEQQKQYIDEQEKSFKP